MNLLCSWETFCQFTSTLHAAEEFLSTFVNFPCGLQICQLSERPGNLLSTSIDMPCSRETFNQLPSTYHFTWRLSVNFGQLFVQPRDLLSTSVNFLCGQETFRQLPSTLCSTRRFFVNLCQLSVREGDLSSTSVIIRVAGRPSINFRQLFLWQGDHPTTYANFPCGARDFPSASINFMCGRETFRLLPSSYRAAGRPPVNFVNFLYRQKSFRQHLSTSHAAGRLSINVHQLSVQPGDLLSTSVNFLCYWETIRQIPSNSRAARRSFGNFRQLFRVAGRTTVNFCQLFVRPGDLLSISVKFLCGQKNFSQLSL